MISPGSACARTFNGRAACWACCSVRRRRARFACSASALYFLGLTTLFGVNAAPFRAIEFLTQFANLILIAVIARRITKSETAGLAAPILYVFHPGIATPMSWACAYNEILWAFLVLAAFYCFLRYIETGVRSWWIGQWLAFLIGFGVLELNVVYPALAALYALCCARSYLRKTIPLFIPSILFAAAHFLVIPRSNDGSYALTIDRGLPGRFTDYFLWTAGPSQLGLYTNRSWLTTPGRTAAIILAAALLAFAAYRIRQRDWRAAFLLGWFVVALAPVLPLANHPAEYYTAVPAIGVCILGGWAISECWRRGFAWRAGAAALVLLYAVGNYGEIRSITRWRYVSSRRLEAFLGRLDEQWRRNPRSLVLLSNVDRNLFTIGFIDNPFRLYGLPRPYLTPGSEQELAAPTPPRGIEEFTTTAADIAPAIASHNALVLAVSDTAVRDITGVYRAKIAAAPMPGGTTRVDVGQPAAAMMVGPTWYPPESGFRWMPKQATVRLAGPGAMGQRLYVSGYAPAVVMAHGPVHLTVSVAGRRLDTRTVDKADAPFEFDFALPADLVGKPAVEIGLEVDHVSVAPGDARSLGLIFGVFEIR